MSQKVHNILQKIDFLQKDMELQKRILFSIPEGEEAEAKAVLNKIAALKEQVQALKESIREVDPEEYDRIMTLEKATEEFKRIAAEKEFVAVSTLDQHGECSVKLKDGTVLECLVSAQTASGDWTLLTLDGKVMELPANDVEV